MADVIEIESQSQQDSQPPAATPAPAQGSSETSASKKAAWSDKEWKEELSYGWGGFRVGGTVTLDGLKAAPELNGKQGKLLSYNGTSMRWQVEVEGGLGTKALKPANLTVVEDDEEDGDEDDEEEEESPFSVGTIVTVQGLKGAAELNGKRGKLIIYDEASERWQVKLEKGLGMKNIKPMNLVLPEEAVENLEEAEAEGEDEGYGEEGGEEEEGGEADEAVEPEAEAPPAAKRAKKA